MAEALRGGRITIVLVRACQCGCLHHGGAGRASVRYRLYGTGAHCPVLPRAADVTMRDILHPDVAAFQPDQTGQLSFCTQLLLYQDKPI